MHVLLTSEAHVMYLAVAACCILPRHVHMCMLKVLAEHSQQTAP